MENATHKNLYEFFPDHFGYTDTQLSFLFRSNKFFVCVCVCDGEKRKERKSNRLVYGRFSCLQTKRLSFLTTFINNTTAAFYFCNFLRADRPIKNTQKTGNSEMMYV